MVFLGVTEMYAKCYSYGYIVFSGVSKKEHFSAYAVGNCHAYVLMVFSRTDNLRVVRHQAAIPVFYCAMPFS